MPSERSARVANRRFLRNRAVRSTVRTNRTKAERAIQAGQGAQEAVAEAIQILDKAVTKGAMHRNRAARLKSRLVRRLSVAQESQ